MREDRVHPLKLFVDGLVLVYHEARHVRCLIEGGYLAAEGWELVLKLPRNRREAWRQHQANRSKARQKPTVSDALCVFEKRFIRNLDDLCTLYDNPNWKHAKTVGGHKWRLITRAVRDLGKSVVQGDPTSVQKYCIVLINSRHNNGNLRDKIIELDEAVGVTTDPWWVQSGPGA